MWNYSLHLRLWTAAAGVLLVVSVGQLAVYAQSKDSTLQLKNPQKPMVEPAATREFSSRDELIASTALSRDLPDPNEPLEALQGYLAGIKLFDQPGQIDRAVELFEQLVQEYPGTRHPLEGLGSALWKRFESQGDRNDLQRAADAFEEAIGIALQYRHVPQKDLWPAAMSLGKLGNVSKLDRLFGEIMEHETNMQILLNYARGLAAADDMRAGEWFKKAAMLRPTGDWDAVVEHGEWLINHKRFSEALAVLSLRPGEESRYLYFLRGYAQEMLGNKVQARHEYRLYARSTERYQGIDSNDPMPTQLRIPGSELQAAITFSDDVGAANHCTGHDYLARMIWCEAQGETPGGRRAAGWVARNRMYNGDIVVTISGTQRTCLDTDNSGSSVCAKYYNVITYGGNGNSFVYDCTGAATNSDSIKQQAYKVFYGEAPEPSMGLCPSGEAFSGDVCVDECSTQNQTVGYRFGDVYHAAKTAVNGSVSCDYYHPDDAYTCTRPDGNVCGNNTGTDNCFWYVTN